jgi:hypothetical protein
LRWEKIKDKCVLFQYDEMKRVPCVVGEGVYVCADRDRDSETEKATESDRQRERQRQRRREEEARRDHPNIIK